MNTRTSPQSATRRHSAFGPVLLLACALLWAQMFGLAHRVLHAPQLTGAPLWQQTGAAAHHGASHAGLLGHLFSPAQGEPECHAYDQLGQTDSPPALPMLDLPASQPWLPEPAAKATVCRASAALFEARGPPAVR